MHSCGGEVKHTELLSSWSIVTVITRELVKLAIVMFDLLHNSLAHFSISSDILLATPTWFELYVTLQGVWNRLFCVVAYPPQNTAMLRFILG